MSAEQAMAVLESYGLTAILTEQDDPTLWAAVVLKHWPKLDAPEMLPAALRFETGRILAEGEPPASNRSGMADVEEWCFASDAPGRLRVKKCGDVPPIAPMGLMDILKATQAGGFNSPELQRTLGNPDYSPVRLYLTMSRPSKGQKTALVHNGMGGSPNIGYGETRVWKRVRGKWVQTEEIVSRWLS
jgi:hypothetical protein